MLIEEEHDPRRGGQTGLRKFAGDNFAKVMTVTGTQTSVNGIKAIYAQGYSGEWNQSARTRSPLWAARCWWLVSNRISPGQEKHLTEEYNAFRIATTCARGMLLRIGRRFFRVAGHR
jgi:hypothetical protein